MELHFGYAEFMRLRMGFLECVDALVNLGLSALYDIRFKLRYRFEVYKEEETEFWEAWNNCLSNFGKKTKLLRKYNLEADDINIISSFAWHSDSDGELSPEECRKLLKWFSLLFEIEKKREKEGENNPLWYVFDTETFDDLKHFRTIVAFAANNDVSLKFS
jgi:hypothetical protein